jgi:hypothetical protein
MSVLYVVHDVEWLTLGISCASVVLAAVIHALLSRKG